MTEQKKEQTKTQHLSNERKCRTDDSSVTIATVDLRLYCYNFNFL